MSNCCNGLLVVTGPVEERRRVARLWTDGEPIFNRILPQPDPFTEEDIARLRKSVNQAYPVLGSDREWPLGHLWWWRRLNWGTTSDVDEADDVQETGDQTIIDFLTDGEPPIPVIEAMSRLFPAITFHLKWFETGCCLAGEARFVAGHGEGNGYMPDSPEFQRLAAEFGYEEAEKGYVWRGEHEEEDRYEDH